MIAKDKKPMLEIKILDKKFILPNQVNNGGPYFLTHSVGPLTKLGQQYLDDYYLSPWSNNGGEAWPQWLTLIDQFTSALSQLLGGAQDEYCPQANLSTGLAKYLMALPKAGFRNTVLMHAHAFPSMGFVVKALESQGYQLGLIPTDKPAHDPQVWVDHMNETTAAILITHVHSNTGVLSPIGEIAQLAKSQDVRIMVDVAQSAGIIPFHIPNWNVDAVFGSCVKWLCGGPGAGWMWVCRDSLSDLAPKDVGWFSHENPFEFDIENFRFAETAKKFWGGTPSIAPYAAALGGVKTVASIGVETIRAHNLKLMEIISPEHDFTHNGGTLCYKAGSQIDAIEARLRSKHARFDRRGDRIRLSLHITNTEDQAQMLRDSIYQH